MVATDALLVYVRRLRRRDKFNGLKTMMETIPLRMNMMCVHHKEWKQHREDFYVLSASRAKPKP